MVTVLAFLKQAKHRLIGNPSAKLAFKRDGIIPTIVTYVNISPSLIECSGDSVSDIRTEAAHVIASLAYGSSETLQALFTTGAHEAVLYAISRLQPDEPAHLKEALMRALRALTIAAADAVGPPLWGLEYESHGCMKEGSQVLEFLYQPQSLDEFLQFLADKSSQVKITIAQLLASSLRIPEHRINVSDWMPPTERAKVPRAKRGWEKLDATKTTSRSRQGGWVIKNLMVMLESNDPKMEEAALSALAALTKDSPYVASCLCAPSDNDQSAFSRTLMLLKSRSVDVQLAACLCTTRIIRTTAHPDVAPSSTLIFVLNSIMADPSAPELARTKACFILWLFVSDDKEQCYAAWKAGSLLRLSDLLKSITPLTIQTTEDWGDAEPKSVSCLREAVLTTTAAIALFDNEMRNDISGSLNLIPYITNCLLHPYVGVRYGACQCARSLSRTVAVMRTSILDTDIGMRVYDVVEKQDEDKRVINVALTVVCNLVHDCSPLRTPLLNRGLVARLVYFLKCDEHSLKCNALWAVKNLLYRATSDEKAAVMEQIGWSALTKYLHQSDPALEEQVLNIMCNLATSEADTDLLLRHIGGDLIMSILAEALESTNENVLCQAVNTLANIANNVAMHRRDILSSPRILSSLRSCLTSRDTEVRKAAVSCVKQLAQASPYQHKELRDAGIDSTLRHLSAGDVVPGSHSWSPGVHTSEIRDAVRYTLHLLDTPVLRL